MTWLLHQQKYSGELQTSVQVVHNARMLISHLHNCKLAAEVLLQSSLGLLAERAVSAKKVRVHRLRRDRSEGKATANFTARYAYDLEKITTFSLLMSPSTKDLGSDPAISELFVDSLLLVPNNPM